MLRITSEAPMKHQFKKEMLNQIMCVFFVTTALPKLEELLNQ